MHISSECCGCIFTSWIFSSFRRRMRTNARTKWIHILKPISHFKCDVSHAINTWIRNGKCQSDPRKPTRRLYTYSMLLHLSWILAATATTTNCDYGSTLEKLLRSGLTLLNDINSHFCLRKCNAQTHIRVATLPCPLAATPTSIIDGEHVQTHRTTTDDTNTYLSFVVGFFLAQSFVLHLFFYFDFLLMVR